MENVIENRRMFIGPDEETEYFIGTPTAENIRNADWQYSKTYTKCLTEGIATSAEMADILRKRGIIGKDFDMRVRELSTNLNDLIKELRAAETNDEKTDLAVRVSAARDELFRWNQRLSGPMSNTCEQIADDARLEFLTAAIIQDKKGNKIWSTYDEFLTSDSQPLTSKARYEAMLYLQGYDADFLEKTPEASAMREVEESIRTEAMVELSRVQQELDAESKVKALSAGQSEDAVVEEVSQSVVTPTKKAPVKSKK